MVLYETYKIFIYAKWGWYFRNACIKFVAENILTMDIKFIYIYVYDDKMQISWAPSHMISSWSGPHIDLGSANINFTDWIAFLRAFKTKVRTINGFMLITILECMAPKTFLWIGNAMQIYLININISQPSSVALAHISISVSQLLL